MRTPQRPPDVRELLQEVGPNRWPHLLSTITEPTHRGRYVHWDKLRYLRPPGDLTHREWWLGLKLARNVPLKALPLRDTDGRSCRFGTPDVAQEHLHHIDQDAGGRISIAEQVTNPSVRDRYILHSLTEEAITSSQLEGAATTRVVAKRMLRSGRAPRDLGERMILNNYLTMQHIREIGDRPLTPELVIDLHAMVTRETLEDPSASGRLRRDHERIDVSDQYNEVLHVPPPARELPRRIASMCDFANGEAPDYFVHPVVRAVILHFWLAYDHPFVDGNGRCARALFYWSMLRSGYWLVEFISISQIIRKAPAEYGLAFLYAETDDNDLTYFVLYHLEVIRKAIAELHRYVAAKAQAVRETERLLRPSAGLNHRQLALLSHALRHPDAEYTIAAHRSSHNVAYDTARMDLYHLGRRGLLIERKTGRKFRYLVPPDLDERLRGQR